MQFCSPFFCLLLSPCRLLLQCYERLMLCFLLGLCSYCLCLLQFQVLFVQALVPFNCTQVPWLFTQPLIWCLVRSEAALGEWSVDTSTGLGVRNERPATGAGACEAMLE